MAKIRLGQRERYLARLRLQAERQIELANARDTLKPWARVAETALGLVSLSRLSCDKTMPIGKRRGHDWLQMQRPRGGHW